MYTYIYFSLSIYIYIYACVKLSNFQIFPVFPNLYRSS